MAVVKGWACKVAAKVRGWISRIIGWRVDAEKHDYMADDRREQLTNAEHATAPETPDSDYSDGRHSVPEQPVGGETNTTPAPTLPSEPEEDTGVHAPGDSEDSDPSTSTTPTAPNEEAEGRPALLADSTDNKTRREKKKTPGEPHKIGGKRTKFPKPPIKRVSTFTPRPELICRNSGGQWEIILSVPEKCDIEEIRHDETLLSADKGEYLPQRYSGNLSVKYADGTMEEISLVGDETPLIFKLSNDWGGKGRKMSGITQGYFIVVAPNLWKRTGYDPGTEPEPCLDSGFLAHFVFKGRDDATDVGGFEECGVLPTRAGFELSGKCLFDDSDHGKLFVGSPPHLETAPGIIWARGGEEKEGGWQGENFKTAEKSLADFLNGRQGRFFVRVYDDASTLVDSDEFRYCENLREIRVNGEPYSHNMLLLPSSDGHMTATLQFIGINGSNIHPESNNNPHAAIRKDGTIEIAPSPDVHKTTWTLRSESGAVDAVITLPRVWWRLEHGKICQNTWRDTPIAKTREAFRELAQAGAATRLRLPSRIKSVDGGFGADRRRSFSAADRLPLDSFIDYEEIDKPLEVDAVLRVQFGAAALDLIRVTGDPLPPSPLPKPYPPGKPPYARVKRAGGGWRRRQGFQPQRIAERWPGSR